MTVTILGTGNIAHHLGLRMRNRGMKIAQVYGRNEARAAALGQLLETDHTTELEKINTRSDIYVIAVSDGAIEGLGHLLSPYLPADKLVVHTSGTVSFRVLSNSFRHCGVLYPLQTFSLGRPIDFTQIPIFVDAPHEADLNILERMGNLIGHRAYRLPEEKRLALHVAAVFVNNFTNYLLAIGEKIVTTEDLPFDILSPLIAETVAKAMALSPQQAQTGPAKRHDLGTLQRHETFLAEHFPEYLPIYQAISAAIANKI